MPTKKTNQILTVQTPAGPNKRIQLGKRAVDELAIRLDAWSNMVSGLGAYGNDLMLDLMPDSPLKLTEPVLNNMYRGDGYCRNLVDRVVFDGMRAGYSYAGMDPKLEKMILDRMHNLRAHAAIKNWWRWGRLHGGSVIFLGIDDGQADLSIPFDPTQSNYKIMFLRVFDRWRVQPLPETDTNPMSATFGKTTQYIVAPLTGGAFRVHESRLIIYDGEPVTDVVRLQLNRWGDSVLTAPYNAIRSLQNCFMNVDHIIANFIQGVMKVEGFLGLIASNNEDKLYKRMQLLDYTRSNLNTIVMDKEEDYEKIMSTVTGLDGLIDKFTESAAAQSNTPVKIFAGTSPAGLQATGDADFRQHYDNVHNQQMERLEPCLRRLTDIIAMEKNQDTGEYEVKFNDLWQPTANDKAQTRWLHAQTDEKNILNGLYSAEEARTCRFEQPDYGDDISGLDTLMDDDNYDGDDENDLKPIDTNAGGVPTAGNPNQDAKATPGVNTGISVQAAGAGTGFAAFGMQQG